VGIKISFLVCLLMNCGFRISGYFFETDIWMEGDGPNDMIAYELDGRLTPVGWAITFNASVLFLGVGMIIGVLVRMIMGPGKQLEANADPHSNGASAQRSNKLAST